MAITFFEKSSYSSKGKKIKGQTLKYVKYELKIEVSE